jgi:hypothetical protein
VVEVKVTMPVNRRAGSAHVVVGHEALERMPGHDREVEAGGPPRVRRRAFDPLDADPAPRAAPNPGNWLSALIASGW